MSTPNYATVTEIKTFKVNGAVALPTGLYTDGEIEAEINLMEEWIEKNWRHLLPKDSNI